MTKQIIKKWPKCPICESKNIEELCSNFKGYIDGTDYEIFECIKCNTQFISTENIDLKIYEVIYSNGILGYDRYLRYAKKIKNQKNPFKYLSGESIYYPIYSFLIDKPKLKILEVGCGYGYLTYSLHSLGHKAVGIDISKTAIDFAKSYFGDYFTVTDLKYYKSDEKFDLIIATELIEHLGQPIEFISHCINLLKTNGKIILTTPNKDYYNKTVVWRTELPPVHTLWLSKNSFKHIAEKMELNYDFTDFTNHVGKNENKLVNFLQMKLLSNNLRSPMLNKGGQIYQKRIGLFDSFIQRFAKKIAFFAPIKYICSNIHKLITKEYKTLGIILWKKKNI